MTRSASIIALGLAAVLLAGCGGSEDKAPPGSAANPLVALPNPTPTRVPPTPDPEAAPTRAGAGAAKGGADTEADAPAAKGATMASRQRAAQRAAERRRARRASRRPTQPKRSAKTSAERPARSSATGPRKLPSSTPVSASKPCTLVTAAQARALMGVAIAAPQHALQGPTCIYRARSGKSHVTLTVQRTSFAKLERQIGSTRRVGVGGRTGHCGRLGQPMLWVPLGKRRVLTIGAPCALARGFAAKALPRL